MLLNAYLDESYDTNSDLIVAGFVASVDQWAQFAEKWKKVLDEHGLPYFHFLEFNKQHLSFEQRTQILGSLIKIITECVILAVSSRISPSEYESLTTPNFRNKYGNAYSLGVMGCITDAGFRLKDRSYDYQELGVYLEQGHPNMNQALNLLGTFKGSYEKPDLSAFRPGHVTELILDKDAVEPFVRIGTIAMGDRHTMRPLQAADMLAYSARTSDKAVSQLVLKQLRDSVDYVEGHWTRNTILYCIKELGIIEKEQADLIRRVNGFRYLNHFGITVHIVSRKIVFDLRQRKDYSVADLHQFLREFYGDSGKWSKDPAEIWADIEAHLDANGIVVHEGLKKEMRERVTEMEAQSKEHPKLK
jgi:hypothetical protein